MDVEGYNQKNVMQPRHSYLLRIFEKLGTPLLAAVVEGGERDRLMAAQEGRTYTDNPGLEAERIAALLKASAEMGFSVSHQLDLRMSEAGEADGVRLTLATLMAPLLANLYRVSGRTPNTVEIEKIAGALQAVTLFADNYNAAADANARLSVLEDDFVPMDSAQVQLNFLHALLPAINAVCTFSFGRPEKDLLQDVMERLHGTARGLVAEMMAGASERDSLRAEISLLRAAANVYSQTHFTEMSKMMFLDENARAGLNLNDQLAQMWAQVDQRLGMLRVMANVLATGQGGATRTTPTQTSPAPVAAPTSGAKPSPFAGMGAKPAAAAPASAPAQPANETSGAAKSSPFAAFTKPKEAASGGES